MPSGSQHAQYNDVALIAPSERCGHPTLHLVLELTRAFSPGELTAAAAHAIERFPVLDCRYEKKLWRDLWQSDCSSLADIVHLEDLGIRELSKDDWLQRWFVRPIDPYSQRPFRIVQGITRESVSLVVSVLHAASDAAGVFAIVHELACKLYGVGAESATGSERGLRQLVRPLLWRARARLFVDVLREAARPLQLMRLQRRTRGLWSDANATSLYWRTLRLEGPAYESFRRCCEQHGATINDGLLAAVAVVAAGQSDLGDIGIYYTVNLRRFLPEPVAVAANLSCGEFVMLPRQVSSGFSAALEHVAAVTRRHKQRFPGLAMALNQVLMNGWLPHGVLRAVVAKSAAAMTRSVFERVLLVTNAGSLDAYLSPFGTDLRRASLVGPFVDSVPVPVITVTGLRSSLSIEIGAGAPLAPAAIDELVGALARALGADVVARPLQLTAAAQGSVSR